MEIESAGCDCQGQIDSLWDWVKGLQARVEELEKWKESQEDAQSAVDRTAALLPRLRGG